MLENLKINKIDWLIIANVVLICIALVVFEKTNIDTNLQYYLFDFENKKWLIDQTDPVKRFWFYNLPKIILGIIIFCSLVILIAKYKTRPTYYKPLFIFFLGITLIPLTIGNIKKFTNVYCPNDLALYNGSKPYVRVLESYPKDFHQTDKGQCFPAGHAITGFCLMILFFVFEKKSWKIFGLMIGVTFGWILGMYQMLKGAHFLSHNFISMLLCFLAAAIISRFTQKKSSDDTT